MKVWTTTLNKITFQDWTLYVFIWYHSPLNSKEQFDLTEIKIDVLIKRYTKKVYGNLLTSKSSDHNSYITLFFFQQMATRVDPCPQTGLEKD